MKTEVKKIDELLPDPNNINRHTQRGHGLVENSIRRRGVGRGILAAGKNTEKPVIMAGNLTHEKARDAGIEEVVFVHTTGNQLVVNVRDDLDPTSPEAIALGIEDNESGKLSYNPDIDLLAAMSAGDNGVLSKLKEDDKIFGDMLEGMGVKDGEPVDAEPQIDRAAELQEKWKTKSGQLWKLGDHRLLIGDCTVRENVERLMGGERAQMCFTSPPYGSESGNLSGVKFYGTKDKDTFDDYVGFLCDFLLVVPVESESPVFVNLSYNDNQRKALFEFAVSEKHGFELYETFIWKKIRSMPLKGDNISRLCEFVFLFSKDRYKIYNRESVNLGLFNFYETKKENSQNKETGNLAAFPIDFPEHFINLFSLPKFIIYEPFGGTGTTIIAALS